MCSSECYCVPCCFDMVMVVESDSYATALAKGNYPTGLDGCFTVGMSGGCGFDCFVLQSGDCKMIDEFLETATKEQCKYLYDNGFYDRLKGMVK